VAPVYSTAYRVIEFMTIRTISDTTSTDATDIMIILTVLLKACQRAFIAP